MRKAVVLLILSVIVFACMPDQEPEDDYINLPYPADEDLLAYQVDVDSGYMVFWTDIKTVAAAYMGNSKYYIYRFKSDNIMIRGEGLFVGMVEIETPDFIVQLRLRRPFQSKGRNSIWQVISAEEKPWPIRKYR